MYRDVPQYTHWFIFLALGAVLIISWFYHPQPTPQQTLCGFKTILGLPCPGCGLTRSFCALAKGELFSAFAFNLLGPFLFCFTLSYWLTSILSCVGYAKLFTSYTNSIYQTRFPQIALAIFVIYGLLRIIYLITTEGVSNTVGQGLLAQFWH
jgi:hypothetical protein